MGDRSTASRNQVLARGPATAASGVQSSSVLSSVLKGLRNVIAPPHYRRGAIRKPKNTSDEVQGSDWKPPEVEEDL